MNGEELNKYQWLAPESGQTSANRNNPYFLSQIGTGYWRRHRLLSYQVCQAWMPFWKKSFSQLGYWPSYRNKWMKCKSFSYHAGQIRWCNCPYWRTTLWVSEKAVTQHVLAVQYRQGSLDRTIHQEPSSFKQFCRIPFHYKIKPTGWVQKESQTGCKEGMTFLDHGKLIIMPK